MVFGLVKALILIFIEKKLLVDLLLILQAIKLELFVFGDQLLAVAIYFSLYLYWQNLLQVLIGRGHLLRQNGQVLRHFDELVYVVLLPAQLAIKLLVKVLLVSEL